MKKNIFQITIFLILISLSFSSLISQASLNGPVSSKPLPYQNALVLTMDNGKIGLFDQNNIKKWEVSVDGTPTSTIVFDNSVIVSTIKTKIYKIDSTGRVVWQIGLNSLQNATKVFGISANQKYIYATADNGAYIIDKDGSVRTKIINYNATIATTPYVGDTFAVIGVEKQLIKVSENGAVQWRTPLFGNAWTSRPVSDGANVYVGALDSKLYSVAISNGNKNWEYIASNWIIGSPAISDGNVYFGDNNGLVYAIETGSGSLLWQTHTNLGVGTSAEIGRMGGKNVVFLGSNDKSVYAINRENGEVVWKGSVGSAPSDPKYYQNSVVFGSEDGTLYRYSAERACSINYPHDGTLVGSKEIDVSGKEISESGGQRVVVKINDADWVETNTESEDWSYVIDPKTTFNSGINTISCKVIDNAGEETGDSFTTVSVNYDQTKPPSRLVVSTSPNPIENQNFTVYVNDGDDGSPVNRFTLNIDNKEYNGSKNISINMPAGSYRATVKKTGFDNEVVTINVNSIGLSPIVIIIAILAIAGIAYFLWSRILKDKFASKK